MTFGMRQLPEADRMKKTSQASLTRQKETSSSRVYTQLRADILGVKIMPGTPLDENSLSTRFGMSRSPIREALVRLSSEGLVQILSNRSIVVAPIDFTTVPQFLDALDLLQRVTARAAAQYRTEEDLTMIIEAQAAYERETAKSLKTGEAGFMIDANVGFHMAVARAGRNSYFSSFYQKVLDEGRRIVHFHFDFMRLDSNNSVELLSAPHIEMICAIRDMDVDRAESVAHEHAEQFKGRFTQFLLRSVSKDLRLDGNK